MDKKKKIIIFTLILSVLILIIAYTVGIFLIDSPSISDNNNESKLLSSASTDLTAEEQPDESENSDIIVNIDVSLQDDISKEDIVLHGWVINNMGYTYFYENSAYEQFNFKTTALERYVNSVNSLSLRLSTNSTDFYNIVVPVSSSFANIPREVYVDDNFYNASQSTFVSTVASKLNDRVTNIPITTQIEEKYDAGEYIFFRSDKNWTALAAYTAYSEFCSASNIKPFDLTDFETLVVEEHLGSFYNALSSDNENESGILFANTFSENPDKIIVYKPVDNVKTALTVYDSGLVYDNYKLCENSVSSWNAYNVFLGKSAERYEVNTNTGGGNLLIIGDESAYPLVPFLACHYGKIDIINPMKFKGNLEDFLSQRSYNDCINICYSTNAVSGEYIPKLNLIIGENNE